MAVKLLTIKDIRNYLSAELSDLYSGEELTAINNIIISKVFGITRLSALQQQNELITDRGKTETVIKFANELKTGKPVQYVTGETHFYNCIIKVSRGVLIPRPETEELADMIIKENIGFAGRILDIGTGSGCIAIVLALNLKSARVVGIDISAAAVKTAIKNAEINNASASFLKADLFRIIPSEIQKADIIVSNPPYVRNSEKRSMRYNVLGFEPHKALFVPDSDPLKFYRAILELARTILDTGGLVYFEINESMGRPVIDLLESYRYREIRIIKDINGKDRFAKAKKDV